MHHATRKAIQRRVFTWYKECGRRALPWRHTRDLYAIAVAEIMLQQTNVPKVVERYSTFLKVFPTWKDLARASQARVLTQWRGLGYNRRALNLHRSARIIVKEHNGQLPRTSEEIMALPGFGPYTAHAVLVFGYNDDTVAVDVNVERLLRRWHVGGKNASVSAELMLPRGESRQWHNALMDFASLVCTRRAPQCATCPLKTLCASYPDPCDYVRTKKKEPGRTENGVHVPRRIYRGRIIDVLRNGALDINDIGQRIKKDWDMAKDRIWLEELLRVLRKEKMITVHNDVWRLR